MSPSPIECKQLNKTKFKVNNFNNIQADRKEAKMDKDTNQRSTPSRYCVACLKDETEVRMENCCSKETTETYNILVQYEVDIWFSKLFQNLLLSFPLVQPIRIGVVSVVYGLYWDSDLNYRLSKTMSSFNWLSQYSTWIQFGIY